MSGKKGEGELDKAEHYLSQLNGRFIFIKGNHDDNNSLKTCIRSAVIEFGGKEILLVHDPADGNTGYEVNLCGHVHEAWKVHKDKKTGSTLVYICLRKYIRR
jgi:calcineurin-like phosphoesterase family protein